VTAVATALIVAADEGDVIGVDGGLPWHLPEDLRRFRQLTTGHVVVAGRRTHDSIVDRLGHPLPGRITVVVTRRTGLAGAGTVIYQPDVASALAVARAVEAFAGRDTVFVIGGAEIYARALLEVDVVHLTRVNGRHSGDAVMPAGWLDGFELTAKEDPDPRFSYLTYRRR
jgi:dihydrofolate reductase